MFKQAKLNLLKSKEPLTESLERKLGLLRIFALLSMLIHFVGILTLTVIAIILQQFLFLSGPLTSLIAVPCFILSYKLNPAERYRRNCWLLVLSNFLSVAVYYWSLGTGMPVMLVLLLPVGLAAILMSTGETIFFTLLLMFYCALLYSLQGLFKIYQPPVQLSPEFQTVVSLVQVLALPPAIIALFILPSRSHVKSIQSQNQLLKKALVELENRQTLNLDASRQISTLAVTLTDSAAQQAGDSREQAMLLAEMRSSLLQLSSAAAKIDLLVEQVNQSAQQVAEESLTIEETTNQSVKFSEQGLTSVNQTTEESAKMTELSQNLVNTMQDLSSKNDKMQVILSLISSIASETHLLSLNASIEAAGAGHFGERFMVVANEIKRLSDSSSAASKEVVMIVDEARNSAKAALEDARAGLERAKTTAEVAANTGQIIGGMRQIADNSLTQAHSINQLVKQIQDLTKVIKQATSAQSNGSGDVLESLNGLVRVASVNAQTSTNLFNAVENLDELSSKLVITGV